MGGLAWFFTSAGGYLAVSMLAYRFQYVRTFKSFRRWQLEAPDGHARWDRGQYGGPGYGNTSRKDLTYSNWFDSPDYKHKPSEFPPQFMFIWPVCLAVVVGDMILHPKIKLPDPKKINEIETGRSDDLDAALQKAEREHACGTGGCVC